MLDGLEPSKIRESHIIEARDAPVLVEAVGGHGREQLVVRADELSEAHVAMSSECERQMAELKDLEHGSDPFFALLGLIADVISEMEHRMISRKTRPKKRKGRKGGRR